MVVAYKEFTKTFKEDNLKNIYIQKIKYHASPGLDRMNTKVFEGYLLKHINIINYKVNNGTYRFTRYREKLILKGRNKYPRLISIPTIRDKVVLKALNELLSMTFQECFHQKSVQYIMNRLKQDKESGRYNYFIKFDISDFYPSINHEILEKTIRRKIRKKEILNLILGAIKTPTVPLNYSGKYELNQKGVPQGLSISNGLANLYLSNLDMFHLRASDYAYYRYVDDIVILCDEAKAASLEKAVTKQIEKQYELKIHPSKTDRGLISIGFNYLGYFINSEQISVRIESVRRLENGLSKLFTEYKYSKHTEYGLNRFIWKLNLKITGCIDNNEKYGWMFFFSQIDDKRLLFHLDWFVKKLIQTYIDEDDRPIIKVKKFVRTYHEIILNLSNTTYIPNFSEYSLDEKHKLLISFFGSRATYFTPEQIEDEFRKLIIKSISDLEKDVQRFS